MSISSFLAGTQTPLAAIADFIPASVASVAQPAPAATSPMSLGDFHFTAFEVPENIQHGMKQITVTHTLIGGRRVVDAMGASYDPIKWDGILLSQDAEERRDSLKRMAASGRSYTLTWGNTALDVVIEDVQFDEKSAFQIAYSISVCVLEVAVTEAAQGSALQAATTDLGNAVGVAAPTGLTGIRDGLSTVLKTAQQVRSGTAQIVGVWNGLNAAKGQIETALADANGIVGAIGSIGQIAENTSSTINDLERASFAFERLAQLGATGGYVGRAVVNVRGLTGF